MKYLYLLITLVSLQANANDDLAKQYLERIYSIDRNMNNIAEDTFSYIINKEFKGNEPILKTIRKIFINHKSKYIKLVNKYSYTTVNQMVKVTSLALSSNELKALIDMQAIFEKNGKFTKAEQELVHKYKKSGLFKKDKELSLMLYEILGDNYVLTYEKFITILKPELDKENIDFYRKKDNTFRFEYKPPANKALKSFPSVTGTLRSNAAPRPLAMR